MKKLIYPLALTAALLSAPFSSAADYIIDTKGAHASINFKVSHLGYSFIQGRFNDFEGQFSFDSEKINASKVIVNIDTRSLDSNHAERDKHIRSSDFINAGKFSSAKFVSQKVSEKNDGSLTINGDLTLHGITKNIDIDAIFIGEGKDPWGGYRAGFQGHTRLQLKEFDIPVVGSSSYVDIELHVEGIRK